MTRWFGPRLVAAAVVVVAPQDPVQHPTAVLPALPISQVALPPPTILQSAALPLLPIPLTAALLRMPIPPAAVLPAMLTPLATAAPPRPAAAAALPMQV